MKKYGMIILFGLGLVLLAVWGDGSQWANGQKQVTQEETIPLSSKEIVAYVNQEPITSVDYERKFNMLVYVYESKNGKIPSGDQQKILSDIGHDAMKRIIYNRLVLQAAKKHGVIISNEELEQVLENIKNSFPSQESFEATMKERGLNEENMREFNEMKLAEERLMSMLGGSEPFQQFMDQFMNEAEIKMMQDLQTSSSSH